MTNDTLYYNGKIFTSSSEAQYVNAFTVKDGNITWVGNLADVAEQQVVTKIDLAGQTVIPGIIDAHMHPLYLANHAKQIACTPPAVSSIIDLKAAVKKEREAATEFRWIEGWGYDEGKLAEKRTPTRYDIDEVCADYPVVLTRTCLHIVTVNSKVLELAGITKDTQDPVGGEIDRDENGEPTGILRENARNLILQVMPQKTVLDEAKDLANLSDFLLSKGITVVTDMIGLAQPTDYYAIYEKAREFGFKQKAALYYLWTELQKMDKIAPEKMDRTTPIHIAGIKLFADGSISGQTAWVQEPFEGTTDQYGMQTADTEEILAAHAYAKEHELPIVIHGMGEQAIDLIINTLKHDAQWLEEGPSLRIEHVTLPTTEAIQTAAEQGIAFTTQPIFTFAEIESYVKNLGVERTQRTYPVKTWLDAGVTVAFSSDAPATAWADPVNPFVTIQAAVTRKAYDGTDLGQAEKIDVETAVILYTKGAQKVTRIANIGQLAVGYQADFVVLSDDIFTIDPFTIGDITVEQTYLQGELVYSKTPSTVEA